MLNHLCDSMIRRLDNHVRKVSKFIWTSPTGVPNVYQNEGRPVLRSVSVYMYLPRISLPACDCCVHIHAGTCTVGKFPRSSCQSCIIITAVHICSNSISYWVVTVHHCIWFSHLIHYYSYRHAIVRTFGLPAEY